MDVPSHVLFYDTKPSILGAMLSNHATRNGLRVYVSFDEQTTGYVLFIRTPANEPNIDWSSLRIVSNSQRTH